MAIADDITTGKGPRESLLQELRSAAPSRSSGGSSASHGPSPTTTLRSPSAPVNSSDRSNPVPTQLYAPGRTQEIADELAMRAGALTTVPGFEDSKAAWSTYASTDGPDAGDRPSYSYGQNAPSTGGGTSENPSYSYGGNVSQQGTKSSGYEEPEDERLARARRTLDAALGSGKRGNSTTLGAEAYKDLSPDQKAAVDFNTLLSKAVNSDRRAEKPEDRASYDAASEAVFGSDSKKYAPATVALLNSIGFESKDINLDDFLKLKTGVTASELDSFTLADKGTDASLATPEATRTALQAQLVGAFKASRESQASGGNLLGLQRSLLGTDRQLGFGQANANDQAPMDQQLNAYFQKGLSALAQPQYAGEKDKIMADIRGHLSGEEWDAFVSYLDVKSREAMQYKQPLLTGSDDNGNPLTFMVARDFRKHIGF